MGRSMNHLLCVGFGYSAKALAHRLDKSQWIITGTSRSLEGATAIAKLGFNGKIFAELDVIDPSVTHIISSVPPGDDGDAVLQKFGAQLQKATNLQWAAYLSTTGVYGDHGGGWVDETTPLTPNTRRGEKRVRSEQQWLALHAKHDLPVHIFRLAGIYGPGRNQLNSLRDGTARRVIKNNQVFSRIHVDDIVGILLASMAQPYPGRCYNVADEESCPPQDVVTYAAKLLGMEPPPEIAFEDATLSSMARSFFADSKRVSIERIKTELGYRLQYSTYREGLKSLLTSQPHQPAAP